MENEMMDLAQLASYLHRDLREVSKLASRGHLPGHKVSGEWRFARAEINHWLETQMHAYTAPELERLEQTGRSDSTEPLVPSSSPKPASPSPSPPAPARPSSENWSSSPSGRGRST